MKKRFFSSFVCVMLIFSLLAGCGYEGGGVTQNKTWADKALPYDDAVEEAKVLTSRLKVTTLEPKLDLTAGDTAKDAALADISTFPIVVSGNGDIDIEVAAATEISADSPDNWLIQVAKKFNKSGCTVGGRSVSVSVRKITSGEVLTYMVDGNYRPDLYIPSNFAWGEMLKAKDIEVIKLADRVAGNTAGILMSRDKYETFVGKHGDVTVSGILDAAIAGELTFAYTNPYTSSTGLNILTAMLHAFDPSDPLSQKASGKLLSYQENAPTAAYTTAVLRQAAANGIVDAMVMEEQAYVNTPELKNYVYTPAGIRHDHPAYTFAYVPDEAQEAAKLFVEYCQNAESQKAADERGFNRHDDYVGQDSGLDGAGYLAAQTVWKTNKNGGKPIVAVFVADTSGSMSGTPLASLKKSLIAASSYIGSDNYIGLVSYSDDVEIDLPIGKFDNTQRSYFSGAVKGLNAGGGTATYDAVAVALTMLIEKAKEVPNAAMLLFVLSDGEQNKGYNLDRVAPIVAGLKIPVYTIGYNADGTELGELSEINEATLINADSDDIVNELRNLFNVNM